MCLGLPMQVLDGDGITARCAGRGEERVVSLLLTGDQPPGTWLLIHIDTAIRVLDAEEARLIDEALDAVALTMTGGAIDHLFQDLAREPRLPDHLLPPEEPAS